MVTRARNHEPEMCLISMHERRAEIGGGGGQLADGFGEMPGLVDKLSHDAVEGLCSLRVTVSHAHEASEHESISCGPT